jgi:Kinesin motor domain
MTERMAPNAASEW